jgi:hypothetical protein
MGATFRSRRLLPFPAQRVFEAFARPELLERWWGPSGFTNTFEVFEFKPGGRWKFVMHGPTNTHIPNESVFLELDARRRRIRAVSTVSRRIFGLTAAVLALGSFPRELRSEGSAPRAYRPVSGACLPCGGESYAVIGSPAELDRMVASLKSKCQEDRSPALWREQVVRSGIDFSKEALVIVYEVIGSGGQSKLETSGPADGVLSVSIAWTVPKGPLPPIATAACFSLAVDKSMVRRVEIRKGGVLNRSSTGDLATF